MNEGNPKQEATASNVVTVNDDRLQQIKPLLLIAKAWNAANVSTVFVEGKAAIGKWKSAKEQLPTIDELKSEVIKAIDAEQQITGVGIVFGKVSGNLIGWDIDTPDIGLQKQIKTAVDAKADELGITLLWYRSGKGMYCIYRIDGDTPTHCKNYCSLSDGGHIERRTNGYSVAPGSMHPNGKTYRWEDDEHDEQMPCIPDIPILTIEQHEAIEATFRTFDMSASTPTQYPVEKKAKPSKTSNYQYSCEDVRDAVNGQYDVEDILTNLGYTPSGNGYTHPVETSAEPSVSVLYRYATFFGANDPIHHTAWGSDNGDGSRTCDAFDLLAYQRGYANKADAMREMSKELGMDGDTKPSESNKSNAETSTVTNATKTNQPNGKQIDYAAMFCTDNPNKLTLKASQLGIPTNVQIIAKYLAMKMPGEKRNTTALMLTLWALSAMAGKAIRIRIDKKYKAALRIADIDFSGSGKTAALDLGMEILEPHIFGLERIGSSTIAQFFKNRGSVLDRSKADGGMEDGWIMEAKRECLAKHRQNRKAISIVADDGMAFIREMTMYDSRKNYLPSWCQLIDDSQSVTYETKTGGTFYLGDPCVALYLNCTPGAFGDFLHNPVVKDSGAAVRILPMNAHEMGIDFDDLGMSDAELASEAEQILKAYRCMMIQADTVNIGGVCVDGQGVSQWETQQQNIVWNSTDVSRRFMDELNRETFETYRGKTAVQAKKIAAVMAAADKVFDWMESCGDAWKVKKKAVDIDAADYYRGAFNLAWHCHATAGLHHDDNADAIDAEKILTYIRKHQNEPSKCTARMINTCVRLNGIDVYKVGINRVNELAKSLVESGDAEWCKLPSGRGHYLTAV